MKRLRSSFKLAAPLALLLGATTAVTITPTPAFADYKEVGSWTGSDGTTFTVYRNDDGQYATYIDKSDTANVSNSIEFAALVMLKPGFKVSGNPAPDASSSKGIEPLDVAGLIAKGLITYTVKANPEDTPLRKWFNREGFGFAPHGNPTDDDNQSRPGLPKVKNTEGGLTDQQKAEITRLVNYAAKTLGELGTSMGDGEALGGESAPTFNKSGSSGRSKGTGTGEGSKNTGVYVPRDIDSLGARPDLVNPPHGKSGVSGAMSPGLLEGGSSLSTNGPSGAGMAIGKGGGTTSRGVGAAGIR